MQSEGARACWLNWEGYKDIVKSKWGRTDKNSPKESVFAEEHPFGAWIYLRKNATRWCVTCAVGRTFEHQATADSEEEARMKYDAMKADLTEILEGSESAPCEERFRIFADTY